MTAWIIRLPPMWFLISRVSMKLWAIAILIESAFTEREMSAQEFPTKAMLKVASWVICLLDSVETWALVCPLTGRLISFIPLRLAAEAAALKLTRTVFQASTVVCLNWMSSKIQDRIRISFRFPKIQLNSRDQLLIYLAKIQPCLRRNLIGS